MALETELGKYKAIKGELLQHHEGKYALIVGEELLGVFDHGQEAYDTAVRQRGNVPMLIKKILKDEPVESIPAMALGLMDAHP